MRGFILVIIDEFKTVFGRAEGRIRVGSREYRVEFKSTLELSDAIAESLLLLALPAAMRCGGPLISAAPVSPRLLENIPRIQDLYCSWNAKLHPVEIRVPARVPATRPAAPDATCQAIAFSGGVDSFYAALQSPGSSLVYVHGFDVALGKHELRKVVSERLAWSAAQLGQPLLEIETNLREFSDRYLPWIFAYGGALAACALLLSRHIDTLDVSAGVSYERLQPDGTHPQLTPLFSTEDLAFAAQGYELNRVEKTEIIAGHPVVQSALRVCWENRGDEYNCGVCEKCLRTMAALEIFGVLQHYSTFSVPFDYGRLSRAMPASPNLTLFIDENLQAARARNASPELIGSLENELARAQSPLLRTLLRKPPRIFNDWYYRAFQCQASTH